MGPQCLQARKQDLDSKVESLKEGDKVHCVFDNILLLTGRFRELIEEVQREVVVRPYVFASLGGMYFENEQGVPGLDQYELQLKRVKRGGAITTNYPTHEKHIEMAERGRNHVLEGNEETLVNYLRRAQEL